MSYDLSESGKKMVFGWKCHLPVNTRSRAFNIELFRFTFTHKWIIKNIVMFITRLWASNGSSKRLKNLQKKIKKQNKLITEQIESHDFSLNSGKINFHPNKKPVDWIS